MKIKHVVIVVSVIGLVIFYYFINPKEVNFLPKCPLYSVTGFYCPGCGSQRATHHLLNFNIFGVLQQNVLYLISLLILGYHFVVTGINSLFKKNIYNYVYHPKTPLIILAIIVVFWILRNIPIYPFNLLAPN
ncbi:MAG: DUF2752 domain-containing protein [Gelidibacter sp.]|nr:DUF2752 domain-containing protein [Gelidibacter sp.]